EIEEIGVLGTPYIENIGIPIFGGNKSVLAPPIPPAVYQLYIYDKENNIQKLLRQLEIDFENIVNSPDGLYSPYIKEFGGANWPSWMKPVTISCDFKVKDDAVIFPDTSITLQLLINNDSSSEAKNVQVKYKLTNNFGEVILEQSDKIDLIPGGGNKTHEIIFRTEEFVSTYQIEYEIFVEDCFAWGTSQTLPVSQLSGSISYMGADLAGVKEGMDIPLSFEIGSTIPKDREVSIKVELFHASDKTDILGNIKFDTVIPANGKNLYAPSNLKDIYEKLKTTYQVVLRKSIKTVGTKTEIEFIPFKPFTPFKINYGAKKRSGTMSVKLSLQVIDKKTGKMMIHKESPKFSILFLTSDLIKEDKTLINSIIKHSTFQLGLVTTPLIAKTTQLADRRISFKPVLRHRGKDEFDAIIRVRIQTKTDIIKEKEVRKRIKPLDSLIIDEFEVIFPKSLITRFYTYKIDLFALCEGDKKRIPQFKINNKGDRKEIIKGDMKKDFGLIIL
ncbi:MAG: hypothetical protein ACTSQE_13065, partial [Candidatus Heimdallarchaeaceae archaeon]